MYRVGGLAGGGELGTLAAAGTEHWSDLTVYNHVTLQTLRSGV